MKKIKIIMSIVLSIAITMILVGCGGSGTDSASGKSKSADKSGGKRIIAGSVAMAEILTELEIDLVGRVSTQYDVPEKIKDLPQVGLPMNPDLEKIVELNPDTYILSGSLKEIIGEKLESGNIPTEYYDLTSYKSVFKTVEEVGAKYDRKEQASKLSKRLKENEEKVLSSIKGQEKKKVMILFGAPGTFMLATKNSFPGSLIDLLGCQNIADAANLKGEYVPFSMEAALKENPDVILRMYHGYVEEAKAQVKKDFEENPQWAQFTAVKENRVYDLDPTFFNVTGNIRADKSLEMMKELLYGKE